MFTGLVEEIGEITSTVRTNFGKKIIVSANIILDGLRIGDSVSINGVCQTVIAINTNKITFEAVDETLKKTTVGFFSAKQKVNLERSLTLQTRLGGHFVQGHVDTKGQIIQINKRQNSAEIYISFPNEYRYFLAHTGSICVDGVSLTTAEVHDNFFKVAVIPETLSSTIAKNYKVGNEVNLEFDIIGKYIYNILKCSKNSLVSLDKKINNNFDFWNLE